MGTDLQCGEGARVLTMNRGSATLKASIYDAAQEKLALSIKVDRADDSAPEVSITDPSGQSLLDSKTEPNDPEAALKLLFEWLDQHGYLKDIGAVGHRIVHGGTQFTTPRRITPEVLSGLESLIPLDPDHLPAALSGIRFVSQKLPDAPQIACFDTAFHHDLPAVARMYALPRRFYDSGLRRFGFHGLSYEYIVGELRTLESPLAGKRTIIAHLGNGASMVALRGDKSVDTSMGFTPLEGLVMGTRSGDVDPGALLYLLTQEKLSPEELAGQLNKKSGLLGISGSSEDVRDLLQKSFTDPLAAEAIELFCYRAKKYIGAYAAVLGGLDLLVFTGGIGEHAAPVREKICAGLELFGIELDPKRNNSNTPVISRDAARVKVRVVATNEDLMIVRHVRATLGWN